MSRLLSFGLAALDTLRLAFGTFLQNPLRAFLTLLGIVIGTSTVVAMMAMIEGFRGKVTEEMSALGANAFQVQKLPHGFGGFDYDKLAKRPNFTLADRQALAEGCPDVAAAAGEDSTGGQKVSTAERESRANVHVWAGTPEYFQTNAITLDRGRAFNPTEFADARQVAVIGWDVADALFPGVDPLGQTLRLKGRSFTVIGTVQRKGSFLGGSQDNVMLLPLSVFQGMYGRSRTLRISLQATSSETFQKAQDEVTLLLRRRRHLSPVEPNNFEIFSNESSTQMLNNLSSVVTASSFGVCLLSLVVGGIGILNIMLFSVTERTREIGLRKALGARKRRILAQFATEAVALSLVGGVIGIAAGFGLSALAHWMMDLPTRVPVWAVMVSLAMSSTVGLLFGIYPAARAAKLDPVEAMRVE